MTRLPRLLLCLALVLLAASWVLGCGVTEDQRRWDAQQKLWELHESLHTEEMNQRIREAK